MFDGDNNWHGIVPLVEVMSTVITGLWLSFVEPYLTEVLMGLSIAIVLGCFR